MSSFNSNQMLLSGFKTNPEPKWNGLAPMVEERYGHVAVALDEKRVMAIGGYDGHKYLKSVSVYDNRTNEWKSDGWSDLNEERSCHSAVIHNNKVYVFGGYHRDDQNKKVRLSSIECLDLSSSSPKWVTLEQQLSCRRAGCAAVAVGNFIYAIGGYDGKSRLSSVEVFDTKTGLIHQDQLSMTAARNGCAAALVGNKIWVVGGENQDAKKLNTIEYLEVNLNTGLPAGQWTTSTAHMTTERYYPAIAAVGHCLGIMGGDDKNETDLSSVDLLDTKRDVCFSLPDMSVPRFGCATVALGDMNIVVFGGYNNGYNHYSVESLTLELKGVQTCFDLSQSKCIESLMMKNVKTFVVWANLIGANELLSSCFDFIRRNRITLFADKEFVALLDEDEELWNCILKNSLS